MYPNQRPVRQQFTNPPNYNPNFHETATNRGASTSNYQAGTHAATTSMPSPLSYSQQPPPQQQVYGTAAGYAPPQQQQHAGLGPSGGASYALPNDNFTRQRPQQPGDGLFDATAAVTTAAAAAAVFTGDAASGARLLETQRQNLASRWMPGFAAFWEQLRTYFAVSHRYVGLKLRALLVPWTKRAWRRQKMNDPRQEGESAIYALPTEDENAPDLYIPLVSFLTFALVTAYVKGQSGSFTPEVLAQIITSCAGFQMFELVLYSTGLYISGAGAPLLDLTCYTGYKYVSLCFNMLATALGSDRAYYAALAWTSLSSSYFMLKTMAQTVPTRTTGVGPKREFLVCGLGITQGFSIWLLGFLFKGDS